MSDAPGRSTRWRVRCAVVLLVLGLLGAVVPALAAGTEFLPKETRVNSAAVSMIIPGPTGRTPVEYRLTGDRVSVTPVAGGQVVQASGGVTILCVAPWTSAAYLVQHEAGWTAAAAAIALAPLLFLWWRRSTVSFGRIAGIACCAAAGASVCAIVLIGRGDGSRVVGGTWWTVPLGAAVMTAAFLVAPTPRVRDD